jgi:hypothetical protein
MAYKDSLFRSLFGNERGALALYNALCETNYREQDTDITINTLEGSMLSLKKNDLSFLVNGKLVVLIEHQSSINRNMPIRFLDPILRLFEGIIGDQRAIHRRALVKLPRPQFIVLYNGTEAFPEVSTLRLSDAFEKVENFDDTFLELAVKVYNINEGHNAGIVGRCEELRGYAFFVARVRYHEDAERKREPAPDKAAVTRIAIRKAIQDCRDKNLLVAYWDNLSTEEKTMLGSDWNWDLEIEVEREDAFDEGFDEGFEKGFEKGREDERKKAARNALAEGFSVEAVQKITGLDLEIIKNLQTEEQ